MICITPDAHAGAWLQPKGHGQLISQLSYYTANEFYDADGQLQPQPRYQQYEVQPYVEYGLRDNLTIGGKGLLQHVQQSSRNNTGLADPEIFLRTTLWKSDTEILSIQPLLKFKSQFLRDRTPRGGSRSTDAEISLLYGYNKEILDPRDFVDIRVGYRLRGNALSDQYRGDVVMGIHLSEHWLFMPAMRTIAPIQQSGVAFSENGEQDFYLVRAEATLQYLLPNDQRVGLTLFKHTEGIQTGSGAGGTLSFTRGF